MVVLLRLTACSTPLLIGLTTACFRHRRRPSCAPLQFPLKSCGFSGAETVRKRFLLWKMGFSAAKIAPSPPYTPPGTIEARKSFVAQFTMVALHLRTVPSSGPGVPHLRTSLRSVSTIRHGRSAPSHRAAFSGPVFRGCALRFAPCARHFSPSGLRTLASSLAAFLALLGLPTACFRHWRRPSCAPLALSPKFFDSLICLKRRPIWA